MLWNWICRILRSCKIIGQLPGYLGSFANLKVLGMSFNKINGPIPNSFFGISRTEFIYLSGNFLTGPVPPWILNGGDNIDLSFNSLTFGSEGPQSCQRRKLNLFASSSRGNILYVSQIHIQELQILRALSHP